MYYLYIARCADGSLYTGITRDLAKRIHEHNHDNRRGSTYTRGRRPVELVYHETCLSRSEASSKEYKVKKMTRDEKEALISGI